MGALRRSFNEARCALEAAALANGDAPEVASYRDMGASQLLLNLQDDEALALYCQSVLGPLEDDSGEYGEELIRSLEAFIEQNGQWEKAARQLFCHRHTLRYRIRRVEELTGRDLGNARDRIDFWLALRGGSSCREGRGARSRGNHRPRHRARPGRVGRGQPPAAAGPGRGARPRHRPGARSGCRGREGRSQRWPWLPAGGGRRAGELRQLPGEPGRHAGLPRGRRPLHRPGRAVPPDHAPARDGPRLHRRRQARPAGHGQLARQDQRDGRARHRRARRHPGADGRVRRGARPGPARRAQLPLRPAHPGGRADRAADGAARRRAGGAGADAGRRQLPVPGADR